jgi:hypothetical protein
LRGILEEREGLAQRGAARERSLEDASWGIRVDAAQPPDEEADEEARNFTI